jgi:hypothetical protein
MWDVGALFTQPGDDIHRAFAMVEPWPIEIDGKHRS